jgi:hypothetical protein
MVMFLAFGAALTATMVTGCAPARGVWYHEIARDRLAQLQEDQIQDNLIRIKAGRPFLHVNYDTINGVSGDEYTGKAAWGDDDTESLDSDVVVELDTQVRTGVEGTFKYTDTFAINAKPVVGNKTVYDAYVIFTDLFVKVADEKLDEGALWQRYNKETKTVYFVPDTEVAKAAYQRIVLLTTLDQGASRKVATVRIQLVDADDGESNRANPTRHRVELFPSVALQSGLLFPRDGGEGLPGIQIFRERLNATKTSGADTSTIDVVTTEKTGDPASTTTTTKQSIKNEPDYGLFVIGDNVEVLKALTNTLFMLEYEAASSGSSSSATIKVGDMSTNVSVKP